MPSSDADDPGAVTFVCDSCGRIQATTIEIENLTALLKAKLDPNLEMLCDECAAKESS